jgi:hypothetical protein
MSISNFKNVTLSTTSSKNASMIVFICRILSANLASSATLRWQTYYCSKRWHLPREVSYHVELETFEMFRIRISWTALSSTLAWNPLSTWLTHDGMTRESSTWLTLYGITRTSKGFCLEGIIQGTKVGYRVIVESFTFLDHLRTTWFNHSHCSLLALSAASKMDDVTRCHGRVVV